MTIHAAVIHAFTLSRRRTFATQDSKLATLLSPFAYNLYLLFLFFLRVRTGLRIFQIARAAAFISVRPHISCLPRISRLWMLLRLPLAGNL